MPTIEVLKPFRYALGGVRVIEIQAGVQELDEEIAACAIEAGWAQAGGAIAATTGSETVAAKVKRVVNRARMAAPEVG